MQHKDAYLWGLTSKFGPITIQLVSNFVLARLLTPEDFGTVGVLAIFFTMASALIDSGLGGSLVKEEKISSIDCKTIATFNFFVSLTLYLVLFSFASNIEAFFQIKNLTNVTRLISLTFIIGAWGIVPNALLSRELKFKTLCIIAITSNLISAIIAIILALMNIGVYALVLFYLINSFVSVLMTCYASKYIPKFGFSKKSFRRLFSFGFFTTVTLVIDTIYENILTSLIGKYLNVKHAGYMSQAKKIEDGLSSSVIKAINNVTFPILTKLRADNNLFKKEANSIYTLISMLSIPILLTASLFSTIVVKILLGNQWLNAAFYLRVLLFAGIIMEFESLIRSFIKSYCAVNTLMKATIIKRCVGIMIIIASLWLSPYYLVYGFILSSFVGYVINSYVYCKLIHCDFWSFQVHTVHILIPSVIYYSFMALLANVFCLGDNLCICCSAALLSIYYFYILPLYGIDSRKRLGEIYKRFHKK